MKAMVKGSPRDLEVLLISSFAPMKIGVAEGAGWKSAQSFCQFPRWDSIAIAKRRIEKKNEMSESGGRASLPPHRSGSLSRPA